MSFEMQEIQNTTEQESFEDDATQRFFIEWCKVNDGIIPTFHDRKDWGEYKDQVLSDNNDGTKVLHIPTDLQLWEMPQYVGILDADTFPDDPEKQIAQVKQLSSLGQVFEHAGVYLNQHLDGIHDGKDIAETLAQQFYSYGIALQTGAESKEPIDETKILTADQVMQVEQWLLGASAYHKRMQRVESGERNAAEIQQTTLRRYFKALSQEGIISNGQTPWHTSQGPRYALQEKTRNAILKVISAPERAVDGAVFRRGIEKLKQEMKFDFFLKELERLRNKTEQTLAEKTKLSRLEKIEDELKQWEEMQYQTFYEGLDIARLKKELVALREQGNTEQLAEKELQIANHIQDYLSAMAYADLGSQPDNILEANKINCVGVSMVGGAFLDELGIEYAYVDCADHVVLLVVTSDDALHWRDMLSSYYNAELENEMITDDASVEAIIAHVRHAEDTNAFVLHLNDDFFPANATYQNSRYSHMPRKIFLSADPSFILIEGIGNFGAVLSAEGKGEESVVAYAKADDIHQTNSYTPLLAHALYNEGKIEEAVATLHKALTVEPEDVYPLSLLSQIYREQGHYEDAVRAAQQIIKVKPRDLTGYLSLSQAYDAQGKHVEALQVLQEREEEFSRNTSFNIVMFNVLESLGRLHETIPYTQKAITYDPNNPDHYFRLGLALAESGDTLGAIAAYEKHNKLVADPGDEWVQIAAEKIQTLRGKE